MCVEILFYSAFLFTSKFTDHVIAAKCPYDEIPGKFHSIKIYRLLYFLI